jgi:hypothetical protein
MAMRAAKRRNTYCVLSLAPVVFLCGAEPANADGGFGEPNMTIAQDHASGRGTASVSETVTVHLSGGGADHTASAGGDAAAGSSIGSTAASSNTATVRAADASSTIIENSVSYSTGFSKGGNSIAKSHTASETTVQVNGNTYAVVKEVAIAAARNTQFGSSAAVGVDASVTGGAGASTSVEVAASKPASR